MHHRNAGGGASAGELRGANLVALARLLGVCFREIDFGVSRRVHQQLRLPARQRGRYRSAIRNIGLGVGQRMHRNAAHGGQTRQLLAELAVGAKYEDHAVTPRRSPP